MIQEKTSAREYRGRRSRTLLRLLLFVVVVVAGVAADLGSKTWIFGELGRPGASPTRWLVPGLFGFQTSLNEGALFGMGQGFVALFAVMSFAAIAAIGIWFVFDRRNSLYLTVTLAMITAGIVGNLWDRLGLHQLVWTRFDVSVGLAAGNMVDEPIYAVRDWIVVMIGSFQWPNFNIADSLLVVGTIFIAGYVMFVGDPFTLASEPNDANPNDAKLGDAKLGDAKLGDAKPGEVKPDENVEPGHVSGEEAEVARSEEETTVAAHP